MERIDKIKEWEEHLRDNSISPEGRLEPSGKIESIMFVGTNPGQASNLHNLWEDPFGKYFGKMLDSAGIDKEKVWMTNLYKYKTENNRPLTPEEISSGKTELFYEIGLVNPSIVVAMGKQATEVFGADLYQIKNWKNFRVVGIPHPSYVNRFPDKAPGYISYLNYLSKYVRNTI
jgi:DNA polymerase